MKKSTFAIINGTKQEVLLGFSPYNMERPKDKADLLSSVSHANILSVKYHLSTPRAFWSNGIDLVDAEGNTIPKDTPNVFVPCDTADTYWRYDIEETLQDVEIHDFATLQEYGKAIGNTTLYSRKLNNVEALGIAAIASKDETYNAIYGFAKKYVVPMNTAMNYFGVRLKQSQTMQLAMGLSVKEVPTLKRKIEEAETLIEMVEVVFGNKEKGKRYAINSINAVINKYDFDTVIEALEKIPASTITTFKLSECHEKEGCLVAELVIFIEELKVGKAA